MRGTFQGVVVAALVATLSWTEIALGLAILSAVISSPVLAGDGTPENAANGDPCGGIRPCDLGGEFTINEMLAQRP